MKGDQGNVVWHYRVHERFGESLHYFFLTFYPAYDRNMVFSTLESILKESNVTGFAFTEVFGLHDMILRVWLPGNAGVRFSEHLENALSRHDLQEIKEYHVVDNPVHWLWIDSSCAGQPCVPERALLERLSISNIGNVQSGQDEALLTECLEKNVLGMIAEREGVRFIITIQQPPPRILPAFLESLIGELCGTLVQEVKVHESILYRGYGDSAWLLMEGIVDFEDYDVIAILTEKINRLGVKRYQVKTTTYLVASSSMSIMQRDDIHVEEGRITIVPVQPVDYFDLDESEQFEIKGSLTLDIKGYLMSGKMGHKKDLARQILKAIVAFLNTRGGAILIGALEPARIPAGLTKVNLDEFPRCGRLIVFGLEFEYNETGWDGFHLKLLDLIQEHIGADIAAMVDIKRYSIQERDVCVLLVPPAEEWQYLDNREFWVRVGPSTRLLEGAKQERFQKER